MDVELCKLPDLFMLNRH